MIKALMSKSIAIAALLLIPLIGEAGPRVGNGGGAWICREKATLQVRWMMLTDLFEARTEHGFHVPIYGSKNGWQIYTLKRNEIAQHYPKLQSLIEAHASMDIASILRTMDQQGTLTVVNDGLYAVRPAPSMCDEGYIYFAQIANFVEDDRLLVAESLWLHPQFSELDRGALLIHEVVYKALRDGFGDLNSVRTRRIVAALFSDRSIEEKKERIETILETPAPPGEESKVALDPVRVVCSARIFSDLAPAPVETVVLDRYMHQLVKKTEGFNFLVLTDANDGKPIFLQIDEDGQGATALLEAPMLLPAFLINQSISLKLRSKSKRQTAVLDCWAETIIGRSTRRR